MLLRCSSCEPCFEPKPAGEVGVTEAGRVGPLKKLEALGNWGTGWGVRVVLAPAAFLASGEAWGPQPTGVLPVWPSAVGTAEGGWASTCWALGPSSGAFCCFGIPAPNKVPGAVVSSKYFCAQRERRFS